MAYDVKVKEDGLMSLDDAVLKYWNNVSGLTDRKYSNTQLNNDSYLNGFKDKMGTYMKKSLILHKILSVMQLSLIPLLLFLVFVNVKEIGGEFLYNALSVMTFISVATVMFCTNRPKINNWVGSDDFYNPSLSDVLSGFMFKKAYKKAITHLKKNKVQIVYEEESSNVYMSLVYSLLQNSIINLSDKEINDAYNYHCALHFENNVKSFYKEVFKIYIDSSKGHFLESDLVVFGEFERKHEIKMKSIMAFKEKVRKSKEKADYKKSLKDKMKELKNSENSDFNQLNKELGEGGFKDRRY